jgi:hypothetical protein
MQIAIGYLWCNLACIIILARTTRCGMITSYSRESMLGIAEGTLIDLETTGLDADRKDFFESKGLT